MARISFQAKSLGPQRTGIAQVVPHPKGSVLRIDGKDVARLSLSDSDYVRNVEASGLRVQVLVEHIDEDGAFGCFQEFASVGATETSIVVKVAVAAIVIGVVGYAIGMAAIRIGIL